MPTEPMANTVARVAESRPEQERLLEGDWNEFRVEGAALAAGPETGSAGNPPPAPRLKPINRAQLQWRVVDVEKLVSATHPVRAIWELTGRLDLSRFYAGIGAVEGVAGQATLQPRLLISLWIYAYSQGISSAREVSRRCDYQPAFQWLTGMEKINHHTLSDFRVGHGAALDELFQEVLAVLSAMDLVRMKRVTQDGTKIRAQASRETFRREGKIRAHLELAAQQIAAMGDPREEEASRRVKKARERAVRERKQRLELALEQLEQVRASKKSGEEKAAARVSETEPEARIMPLSEGGFAPAYNVQISADAAEDLIVGVEVSQCSGDHRELIPAVERMEAKLGQKPEQVVADGGYTNRENILEMHAQQVELIGSLGEEEARSRSQLQRRGVSEEFRPNAFVWEEAANRYCCPAGKILSYEGKKEQPGCTQFLYRAKPADCLACVHCQQCCPQSATHGRMLVRTVEHPVVVQFREKMETEQAKQIYRERARIAEFPHAWIKDKLGLRRFRVRGLAKVRMEALWACLTYNIQQWIRLRWKLQWAQ